ncbi:hypothetical protein FRC00_003114, partial [Tulasnella sp. 408]
TKLQVVGTTSSGAEKAKTAILESGGSQEVADHDVKGSSKGTKPIHEGTGYGGSTSGGYGGADEFGGDPQGNVRQQESPQGNASKSSTTKPTFGGSKMHQEEWASRLTTLDMDVREEDAIAHAAKQVKERFGSNEVRLVVNVSGVLHAEKNLSAISSSQLLETFKINTFGHLLVYKHFTPLLPHKKQVDGVEDPAKGVLRHGVSGLVSVSARVGSIGDNERGGSKAALNQIVRTLSHELNRRSPQHPAFCIAYHPGTMRTALSEPYTRGQTPENTKGLFDVDEAAAKLVELLSGMTVEKSGGFWAYDGTRVPW